jgi:hypothetical protein
MTNDEIRRKSEIPSSKFDANSNRIDDEDENELRFIARITIKITMRIRISKNPPGRSPIGAGGLLFANQIWRLRLAASQREAAYPTATTSASFVFVDDDEMTAAIAPDAEQGAIVVGAFLGHFDCFFGGLDRFAINFLDDVTGFQSGFGSR